jgi:hypothetical protein
LDFLVVVTFFSVFGSSSSSLCVSSLRSPVYFSVDVDVEAGVDVEVEVDDSDVYNRGETSDDDNVNDG